MKKLYLILGLVFGLQTLATAQLTCGDSFVDSGGAAGDYALNETDTFTICPVSPTDVATITFTAFDLEDGWDFMYIIDGDLTTGTLIGSYTGATNPGTITSENVGACMTVVFVSDDIVTAAGWEATIGCVAGPTCLRPSGVTGSVTENSATLSWTANSGETSWGVEYGPTGFAQGTGTWMVTSSNPLTLNGLTDLTGYDFYVYAKCSGIDSSSILGPVSFMTNGLPLTCGDMFYDSGNDTADYNANENYTRVICPSTPGEVVVLTFSEFNTENNYDSLIIFNGNSTASPILGVYQGTTSPGTIFSTDATGCLTAWFESDNSIQRVGWSAAVTCQAPITCFAPTNLTSTVTDITATVAWTNTGSETEWIIEYDTNGFVLGTGMTVIANSNPFTITGLTQNTDYDFYIRAICGAGDTSLYSVGSGFTTDITPTILPQLTCGDMFYDSGLDAADYQANEYTVQTICPTTPGEVVVLTFTEFDTEGGYDSLTVYDGGNVTDPLVGIYQGTVSPGTIYSTNLNGCLTAVFRSDNIIFGAGWAATVTCQAPITCFAPSNLSSTVTDVTATVSWTNGGSETMWAVEYGAPGFAQGSGTTVIASANPFTITGLTELTDYEFYVRAICGAGDTSFYSTVDAFTTDMSPLPAFVCGNLFTDAGGSNGDYSNDTNDTIVICPTTSGDVVSLTFSEFQLEAIAGNGTVYDSLTFYDGNDISGALIGSYAGANTPGTVIATNITGCLTAVFISDGSGIELGWSATITCAAPVGTCATPTNPVATSVTTGTASLGWTNGGTETAWLIEYGVSGFTPGTGTMLPATANPITIGGLTANTSYQYYVTAVCSVSDTSSASTAGTFTTLNNAGISENEINTVSIAPNPSTGKFVIKNTSGFQIDGQLFDAQGRVLDVKVNTIDANKEVVLDLNNFVDGVYFFKTSSVNGMKTYSLVKN